jgi:hypothetical protein
MGENDCTRYCKSDDATVLKFSSATDVDQAAPLVRTLLQMRDRINPAVLTSMDEVGTILPNDNIHNVSTPDPLYYQASAAMFAYSFVTYAAMGVDILGMSQVSCPSRAVRARRSHLACWYATDRLVWHS